MNCKCHIKDMLGAGILIKQQIFTCFQFQILFAFLRNLLTNYLYVFRNMCLVKDLNGSLNMSWNSTKLKHMLYYRILWYCQLKVKVVLLLFFLTAFEEFDELCFEFGLEAEKAVSTVWTYF